MVKILDEFLVIGLDFLIRALRRAVQDFVVFFNLLEVDPLHVVVLLIVVRSRFSEIKL